MLLSEGVLLLLDIHKSLFHLFREFWVKVILDFHAFHFDHEVFFSLKLF
jgi:hypothetical protein